MAQTGIFNPEFPVESFGFKNLGEVYYNLTAPALYEHSLRRNESVLAAGGALVAETGAHTGRSAKDKFVVRDETTENNVWWENNGAITPAHFDALLADFIAHAEGKDLFVQDLYGGADPAHRIKTRVVTEYAWHSLFIRNLLIRPAAEETLANIAELTIVDLPSFRADPKRHGCRSETIIAVDFARKIVLIGGTSYAGEMKKSVFTYLNYVLPTEGVMPMHCSANVGDGHDTAIFFGLSGTGKTTLSADSSRTLIGDDEHGWSKEGVFNFEGGCYAKAIKLSREAEPEIYATTERFGTVMENVVLDPETRAPDFDDGSKTENTRVAYPLDFIPNASATGRAGHPKNIVLLTCDAFGVLPPIAKLDASQAMYHFLSGYTAKVAGTEKGVTEPSATFSTCFGAPFMPRHPSEYGNLLRELIAKHHVDCWLVNTGWTGGKYGTGRRMPIRVTRRLLAAALDGSLNKADFRTDPYFGLAVPASVPGVEPHILNPVKTWASKAEFAETAQKLVKLFRDNFVTFEPHVDAQVRDAAPAIQIAAE
ncbi:phosphoenolpyruvate carboxykinase [Rhodoblastus acidophilus]|uniref:Phosphoenolpyruvate carboxykinase (ATP) n=1 Tax=Candidatus Rhodoblastus alkanivorans TaxID=2954117 RepID=A0ABS9Z2R3_9HYPH|nr:phosphoenolpyruvate carboxykinase [Candidatus Rhodoblastus alkanivorans]MCI4680456.1 phosphoenolpyruvate carboxykinase [Candidatus Rhodoblastus alkanivorans]MCI4681949.1 phosphoenolpyruvate carboxykinase [Candidatus Rhodoblastus alkanivorans]MDI4642999.1 phosphoenolpyruvate carboxykinase [Rhodoblastus acidophilus]